MIDTMVGRYVAHWACAAALSGCSVLYDPGDLPARAVDGGPDVDAPDPFDPKAPQIEKLGPAVLLEGQGDGGSRQAVLTLSGHNISPAASITLTPEAAEGEAAPVVMMTLDMEHAVRSATGLAVAIPVTLPVDVGFDRRDVVFDIVVSQVDSDGIMHNATAKVTVTNLPELTAPVTAVTALAPLYSKVALTSNLTITPADARTPLALRAVSSVELKDVHVDASGQIPGPGGAMGGAAGKIGLGLGPGLPAALIGSGLQIVVAASGGGYGEPGGNGTAMLGSTTTTGGAANGDELLLAFPTGGSGGGGGANAGGASGGSIEITAGGTLTAGTITARGGNGGADALLTGAGGGGSGGAVLLRAGGAATVAKVDVSGGLGGVHIVQATAVPGNGGRGRLRYDAPTLTTDAANLPATRRPGVVFIDPPLITTSAEQSFMLRSVVSSVGPLNDFDYYVFNADKATFDAGQLRFVTPTVVLTPHLDAGWNQLCITPRGKSPITDVTLTSCVDLAYVP